MRYTNKKISSILRQKGYKMTPQRRAVLSVIGDTSEYFSPDDIFHMVKREHSGIGLVTIYRTLNILTGLGLLCEVHTHEKRASYVVRRPAEHHHHLVCSDCGTVIDFGDCELKELEKKLTLETGFEINSHLLEFSGYCRDCKTGRNGET